MNIYYYTYYNMAIFAKKVRKDDDGYAFTGFFCLTLLIALNVVAILLVFLSKSVLEFNSIMAGSILVGIVGLVNYFLLLHKKKYEAILEYYDKKFENNPQKTSHIILIIVYVVASYFSVFYIASIIRDHRL